MHNDRKKRLGLFALLLVCALLLPVDRFTATAAKESPSAATVFSAASHIGVAARRQADPVPADNYIPLPAARTAEPAGLTYTQALEQRRQVMRVLQRHLGTPYVYGGARPGGFDCSGIIYYIYNNLLGYPISRCADTQLLYDGIAVSADELQVGDLVFFRDPGSPWAASHAGIYVGGGQMIHASSSKGLSYASIHSDYYSSRYVGAKRLIQADISAINPDISGLGLR